MPLAWIGGRLAVPEAAFVGLLAASLLAAGLAMLAPAPRRAAALGAAALPAPAMRLHEPALGGGLGLLSGVVGIGGGIFLAPVLHLTRWAEARAVAGTAALFILVNSLAGLAGQLTKLSASGGNAHDALAYWPLLLAVIVGGQVGSRLGAEILPPVLLRRLTAALVLLVGVRLLFRFASLIGAAP